MQRPKKIENELETNYRLIGIATALREYRLAFLLNGCLQCDFRKVKDLTFHSIDRTRTIHFSVLKAGDENTPLQLLLFSNKNAGDVLLPEVHGFDFILQIKGVAETEGLTRWVSNISALPEVVLCLEIPLTKIKSRERLTYEEEKTTQRLLKTKRFC